MANFRVRVNDRDLMLPYTITYDQCLEILTKEVPSPQLKYLDEEAELITVDNQIEFLEALATIKATGGFFEVVADFNKGSTIEGLPILESHITPFGPQGPQPVEKEVKPPTVRAQSSGREVQDMSMNTGGVTVVDNSSQHQQPDLNAKCTGPENAEKGLISPDTLRVTLVTV